MSPSMCTLNHPHGVSSHTLTLSHVTQYVHPQSPSWGEFSYPHTQSMSHSTCTLNHPHGVSSHTLALGLCHTVCAPSITLMGRVLIPSHSVYVTQYLHPQSPSWGEFSYPHTQSMSHSTCTLSHPHRVSSHTLTLSLCHTVRAPSITLMG